MLLCLLFIQHPGAGHQVAEVGSAVATTRVKANTYIATLEDLKDFCFAHYSSEAIAEFCFELVTT